MVIPYSTDAPIYYFPWMTIVLIVVNGITFAITGMGYNSDGWLLQYGNGLHPLEWIAYNFLHFGPMHLIGNMFFLWAFGIVVEGKLGWWKFLAAYMGVGVTGGFLIQLTMLGYQANFDDFVNLPPSSGVPSLFEPTPAFAQEDEDGEMDPDMADDEGGAPGLPIGDEDDAEMTPAEEAEFQRQLAALMRKPGAGGASLAVFALLGIVLVWAPKNEVSCFYLIGFRAGTFECEYLYFCGFKIVMEMIGAIWALPGFEVTSEVGHALGASLGFGAGALFVKRNWVDCENWDLFAYIANKHGAKEKVGAWQDYAALSSVRMRREVSVAQLNGDDDDGWPQPKNKTKKRAKSKLKALESLDDDIPEEEPTEEPTEVPDDLVEPEEDEEPAPKPRRLVPPPIPVKPASARNGSVKSRASDSPLDRIRVAIQEGRLNEALAEVRRQRSSDVIFELPKVELRALADGFYKLKNIRDSKLFLEEFIERFPEDADRQRVKLAILFIKFLKRPTAALKLLASVDKATLPEEYQPFHQEAARLAQQMIADGAIDAS